MRCLSGDAKVGGRFTMSRLIFILLVSILSIQSACALAQSSNSMTQEDQRMADARALLQAGRAEIIREEILFTEAEAAAFWPAYEAYLADLNVVRDRHVKLIMEYLEAYYDGEVSEKFASKLVDDYLAIRSDVLKVQKKHLRQFRRVLPARKVARFYQLENKMNAEMETQLARVIPLVDPV